MDNNYENININLPCQRYSKSRIGNDIESINKYLQNHCMILKSEGVSDDMIYNSVKILGLYKEGLLGYGINDAEQYMHSVLDGYCDKCSEYYSEFDGSTPYCYSCSISNLNQNGYIDDEYKIVGYAIRNEETSNAFRNSKYNLELLRGVYVTENVSCSDIKPIKLNYILALYCCEYALGQYDDIYNYINEQYGSDCENDLRIFMTGYADKATEMAADVKEDDIAELFKKLESNIVEKSCDEISEQADVSDTSTTMESLPDDETTYRETDSSSFMEIDDDFSTFFLDNEDDTAEIVVADAGVSIVNNESVTSEDSKVKEKPSRKKTKKNKTDDRQYDLSSFIRTDDSAGVPSGTDNLNRTKKTDGYTDIKVNKRNEQPDTYDTFNNVEPADVVDCSKVKTKHVKDENNKFKGKNKRQNNVVHPAPVKTDFSDNIKSSPSSTAMGINEQSDAKVDKHLTTTKTLDDTSAQLTPTKDDNCSLIPDCGASVEDIRSLTAFLDTFDSGIRRELENGILNDGCIYLELLRDENENEYYCVYIDTLKKFYSFKCDNTTWVDVIIPFVEKKSFKVVTLTSFNLLPLMQRFNIKVRCLHSIQLMYGIIYGNEPLRSPDEMIEFLVNVRNVYKKPFPIFALPYCGTIINQLEMILENNSGLAEKFDFFNSLEIMLGGSYDIKDIVSTNGQLFSMPKYMEYVFNVVSSLKYNCGNDYSVFSMTYRIKNNKTQDKITHLFKLLVQYEKKGLQRGCPIRIISISANRLVVAIKGRYEMQLKQFFWLYTEVISINDYGCGCEIGFDKISNKSN